MSDALYQTVLRWSKAGGIAKLHGKQVVLRGAPVLCGCAVHRIHYVPQVGLVDVFRSAAQAHVDDMSAAEIRSADELLRILTKGAPMPTQCFFLEPTEHEAVYLRRYRNSDDGPCPGPMATHNAMTRIGERVATDNGGMPTSRREPPPPARDDPRWPAACTCGELFRPDDAWQVFTDHIYRRTDTGELMGLRDAPPGAMYFATWWEGDSGNVGSDGKSLCVRLPTPSRHDWAVDSRCSNCDSPCANCGAPYHAHGATDWYCTAAEKERARGDDWTGQYKRYLDARPHKCWVRHGTPPRVTVDKDGLTCGAGAGSIAVPGYHGHLQNGYLTDG